MFLRGQYIHFSPSGDALDRVEVQYMYTDTVVSCTDAGDVASHINYTWLGNQLSSSSQSAYTQILASVSSSVTAGAPAGARLQYSAELREIALDALTLLFQLPGFTAELYVNYDASLFAPNMFEQLAEMLAKARSPTDY